VLRVATPQAGESFLKQFGNSPERYFDESVELPGFRITNQKQLPDGSVDMQIEFADGINFPGASLNMKEVNGEWRISELP
jgi:hypothetical protein